MLKLLSLFAAVLPFALGAPTNGNGTIWAVLVAGSSGWYNYRHQADVCHAYQIFRRHGVPDSHIIVMMADDLAYIDENPYKGKLFNQPNGPDVYKNVPKDYTGAAVTPENFIKVLTGDKSGMDKVGSGKVLKSGPNDHVFVNFVDHGGAGLIGFPGTTMTADQLIKALKKMHSKKMYKKLVFYLEACESGSMFKGLLPSNTEVYATTAANAIESSYACYYNDTIGSYLGDVYSVTWMEDIDKEEKAGTFMTETLLQQFKKVKKLVTESHVQKYGDMSFTSDDLPEVFGSKNSASGLLEEEKQLMGTVSSRDVPLHSLKMKILHSDDLSTKQQLQKELDTLIKGRKTVDELFHNIISSVSSVESSLLKTVEETHFDLYMDMFPCYRTLLDAFTNTCVNFNKNTYAMSHLYKLANLCTLENFSAEEALQIFNSQCTESHRAMTGIN